MSDRFCDINPQIPVRDLLVEVLQLQYNESQPLRQDVEDLWDPLQQLSLLASHLATFDTAPLPVLKHFEVKQLYVGSRICRIADLASKLQLEPVGEIAIKIGEIKRMLSALWKRAIDSSDTEPVDELPVASRRATY